MIGGSSGSGQPSWSAFFRSSSSSTSSTSRSTSNDTTPPNDIDAPGTVDVSTSAIPARSILPESIHPPGQASRSVISAAQPSTSRLHFLTERKLEKAALGKAVGLRQLVLLSNAFASRSASPVSPTSPNAAHPRLSPSSSFEDEDEDEELDPGIVDLEDEMERKKREEDWLDSVLDQMLTDERDNHDDAGGEDDVENAESGEHAGLDQEDYHHPVERLQRAYTDFSEPYVHVSINKDWRRRTYPDPVRGPTLPISQSRISDIPASTSVLHQHLQRLAEESFRQDALLHSDDIRDSGYLEPALVPLPASPDKSSDGSAHSDDGADTQSEVSTALMPDDAASADIGEGAHAAEFPGVHHEEFPAGYADPLTMPVENIRAAPIPIDPLAASISAPYSSSNRFVLGDSAPNRDPPTPELSHSVNSFFSNLSSSPSASLHLPTPASSPHSAFSIYEAGDKVSEESAGASLRGIFEQIEEDGHNAIDREAIETMLPMDDLDNVDEAEGNDRRSDGGDSSSDSSGNTDSTQRMSSRGRGGRDSATPPKLSSSLELVRYSPPVSTTSLPTASPISLLHAFRIPTSSVLATTSQAGGPAHGETLASKPVDPPRTTSSFSPTPYLPSGLLSTLLSPPTGPKYTLRSAGSRTDPTPDGKEKEPHSSGTENAQPPDIALPILLSYEAVKSLYDSVDFGVPPRSVSSSLASSPVHSPPMASAPMPGPLELGSFARSMRATSPPPGSDLNSGSGGNDRRGYEPNTAKSCPTSPKSRRSRSKNRSRSKSISEEPTGAAPVLGTYQPGGRGRSDGVGHDSSGSILFSSLGLYTRLASSASTAYSHTHSHNHSHISDAGVPPLSLGQAVEGALSGTNGIGIPSGSGLLMSGSSGIAEEWERRRGGAVSSTYGAAASPGTSGPLAYHPQARSDSRSPSRLRLHQLPPELQGDFEFGSI